MKNNTKVYTGLAIATLLSLSAVSQQVSAADSTTTDKTVQKANTPELISNKTVVNINYVPGYGIAVWDAPGNGHVVPGKNLKTGTKWKTGGYVTVNGVKWYNLGGKQWISEKYADETKGEIQTGVTISNQQGVGVVYNTTVGANIWNAPEGKMTNRILKVGSKWKIFKVALGRSGTYYNLGGNQWVLGKYLDVSSNDESSATKYVMPVKKVIKITNSAGVKVFNSPEANGVWTGQVLKSGSSWKVSYELNNGFLWQKVGTNQWIQAYLTI